MKKILSSEKGITLTELLAVITIGGIVMVLILGIFSNHQKQYQTQTVKADQLNDIRYIGKVITKKVRMADKVSVSDGDLILGKTNPIKYELVNSQLKENEKIIATNIAELTFEIKDRTLSVELQSEEKSNQNQNLSTSIYIRKGVVIE